MLWVCVIVIEPISLGMRSGAAFYLLCFSFTQFYWGPSALQSSLPHAHRFWFLRCFFGPSEGFVRPFVLWHTRDKQNPALDLFAVGVLFPAQFGRRDHQGLDGFERGFLGSAPESLVNSAPHRVSCLWCDPTLTTPCWFPLLIQHLLLSHHVYVYGENVETSPF